MHSAMSHYIWINILVSHMDADANKTQTCRCSSLQNTFRSFMNSLNINSSLLITHLWLLWPEIPSSHLLHSCTMQVHMWIMRFLCRRRKTNHLCKSSLNAITLVSSQQGQTCPLHVLESVAMMQNALCSCHSKVTLSNFEYITVTGQIETTSSVSSSQAGRAIDRRDTAQMSLPLDWTKSSAELFSLTGANRYQYLRQMFAVIATQLSLSSWIMTSPLIHKLCNMLTKGYG